MTMTTSTITPQGKDPVTMTTSTITPSGDPTQPDASSLITAAELAARWGVKEGWIRTHSWDCKPDPIPNYKLGKFVRYRWGSPELHKWIEKRRRGSAR